MPRKPELIVFGKEPPGIKCHDRYAAYAVIGCDVGHVAAVGVKNGGRVQFWLPGGGNHDDELPRDAVVREVQEELEREVQIQCEIGSAVQFFHATDDDCWYRMIAYFFSAQLLPIRTSEAPEFELQWISPSSHGSRFFHECHLWATQQ